MVNIPTDRPLCVNATRFTQDMSKMNDEIAGLIQQRHNHVMALKEIERVLRDTKNKKIKKVYIPSFGGVLVEVSSGDDDLKKLYTTKEEQMKNAISGIEGQLVRRMSDFNELILKAYRLYTSYILSAGLELPTDFIYKPEEKKEPITIKPDNNVKNILEEK